MKPLTNKPETVKPRPRLDGPDRTRAANLTDEPEFQELVRMMQAGELDTPRTLQHLKDSDNDTAPHH